MGGEQPHQSPVVCHRWPRAWESSTKLADCRDLFLFSSAVFVCSPSIPAEEADALPDMAAVGTHSSHMTVLYCRWLGGGQRGQNTGESCNEYSVYPYSAVSAKLDSCCPHTQAMDAAYSVILFGYFHTTSIMQHRVDCCMIVVEFIKDKFYYGHSLHDHSSL